MPNQSIDLNILDNEITNLTDVINFMNTAKLDTQLIEHLKTLKNGLSTRDISNKGELINLIDSKILEFETLAHEQNNLSTLRMLQGTSENYSSLGIISSPPSKNDSGKYIDYLTYTDPSGQISLLVCEGQNELNNFIQANVAKLPSLSAEEIFYHFKEYVHRSVEFMTPSSLQEDSEKRKNAIVNDPEMERMELDRVEEYKEKYGLVEPIDVAIDYNGERIYRIGDGLITFHTVGEVREMEVLKQPTINKEKEYEDLLQELDEPSATTSIPIEEPPAISADSYASIENINTESFNEEELLNMISKRDVYELELSSDEQHLINVYVKYLLEEHERDINNKDIANHTSELITNIMESNRGAKASIIATFEFIEDGELKPNELTDLEKEFARIYIKQKEKANSLGLNHGLERKLELKEEHSNMGISTIVVLLEIITIAMFILMFLRLDI